MAITDELKKKDGSTVQRSMAIGLRDGGEVSPWSLKGMYQAATGPKETVTEKYARQDAARAKRPAVQKLSEPPTAISDYAGNSALQRREQSAGLKDGGDLRTGQGGHVPGSGKGDKIDAKYEPGEFVVSNDMLEKSPGLREMLHELREKALADKGMTTEQADAKAISGETLRAQRGYEQIPGESRKAPAFDGQDNGNDFTRNVNNSLNALGGMGVMASVPLKAAKSATSGLGAINNAVKTPALLSNSMPGANFIAGASGVRAVGGTNLPAVINAGAPVAKSVNVALQEGAKANQLAAGTRSLGNASAALGVMDAQQVAPTQATTPGQLPVAQGPTDTYLYNQKLAAAQAMQARNNAIPRRGAYSEENAQAYLSANDKLNSLTPSYFSQATPTSAQNLAQAGQAANAALGNIYSGAGAPKPAPTPSAPGAAITGNAVVRNAMAAGASANPAAPAQANPAVAPPVAPGAQPKALDAMAAPAPGAVTRVGNSYSGTNVAGDISINGQGPRGGVITAQDNQAAENLARRGGQSSGFGTPSAMRGGGQVSSMDTSAGYASDLRQLAEIDKTKAAQQESMQGQADYAAMRAGRMSKKDYQALQLSNKADDTTRRGQDITAANQTASQKLADQRFGLDSAKAGQDATNAGIENEAKNLTLNAQKAFLNAKTPEEQQSALAVLTGLSGKAQQSSPWKGIALQGSTDAMGNKTEGVLAGINEQTGEFKRFDQTQGAKPSAPPNTAVQMLKNNPNMAAQFDAKYGPGASKQYLAQK